jgi:hypothetical protein
LRAALQVIALDSDFFQLGGLADERLSPLPRSQQPALARKALNGEIDDQRGQAERGQIRRDARDQDESPRLSGRPSLIRVNLRLL